jgi:hypothetical protein
MFRTWAWIGKENVMPSQKDDLVAEARVALAIKQAAEICDDIQRAADEIVDNGADRSDYYQGKSFGAEQCGNKISRLPHDPEALEAYVQKRVDEALDWAADQVKFTDRTTSRLDIAAAIRAMMGGNQ